MPFAKNYNILIIDNNFLIREVIKSELTKLAKRLQVDFKFYSADNGLQGLGYLYSINPDLIIVDTTLPDYSGRDIVEYIFTNNKFSDAKAIVLTHSDRKDLPLNFVQISKTSKDFLDHLFKETQRLLMANRPSRKLFKNSKLAVLVSRLSNFNDILQYKRYMFILPAVLEGLTSMLFSLYMIGTKRGKESIPEQRTKDNLIFRLKVYPSLGVVFTSILVGLLQLSIFLGIFAGFFTAFNKPVLAASYSWDGGGTDGTCGGNAGDGNKWSCAANWSSDIVPTSVDNVTFDGTSTKNAVIDAGFSGNVATLNINAGYTGTITQQVALTVNGAFSQSAGTFTASNQSLTVTSTFTLNAGATFTASSGTSLFYSTFTINGGTFNHNNGTVSFVSSIAATLTCNNVTFNLVSLSHAINAKTISSNCSFPLGNNPSITGPITLNGTLSGTGTLTTRTVTMASGSSLSGFTALAGNNISDTFTFNGGSIGSIASINLSGHLTVATTLNASSFSNFTINGDFTLNAGGVFTAPATMQVNRAFALNAASTFNHNNGLLAFGTPQGISANVTISCASKIFNLVQFAHNANGTKTVSSDCNMPLGNNPNTGSSIVLNGTFSGTGTIQTPGSSFTLGATGAFSGFTGWASFPLATTYNGGSIGSITSISGGSQWNINATFNLGAVSSFSGSFVNINTGTFTAPATMTISNTFVIDPSVTFNANGGTLNLVDGSNPQPIATCNSKVFNRVTFSHTNITNWNVSSGCTFPLGNNPTVPGPLSVNGVLSGTGAFTGLGTISLNSNNTLSGFTSYTFATVNVNGNFNASTATTFDVNGDFTEGGGTFTAPSLMTVAGGLGIYSGTFVHNNGTITFDGFQSANLQCNTSPTFNFVTFTHSSGEKIVNLGCNFPLGNNPTVGTTTSAHLTLWNSGTVSGTGTITTSGNLTMNSAASTISGFTGVNTQSFTLNGGTMPAVTSMTAAGVITVGTTWNAGSYTTFDTNSTFQTNSGANFTAPPLMTVGLDFTLHSASTFNANGGTITFDTGGNTAFLTCNNKTLNLVTFAHPSGTKSVTSTCNLPLGNNPTTSTGAIYNYGTMTGTGTATFNGDFGFYNGATISNFTEIIHNDSLYYGTNLFGAQGGSYTNVNKLTVNNDDLYICANFNNPSISIIDVNGDFKMENSCFGTFTAPSQLFVSGDFISSRNNSFVANGGTVIMDGNTDAQVDCSGTTTFNLVSFQHTGGTKTNHFCQIPLGNNPVSTGNMRVYHSGGGFPFSGTGKWTINGDLEAYGLIFDGGITELELNNFTIPSNNGVYWNFPNLTAHGDITLNADSLFYLPPVINIEGDWNNLGAILRGATLSDNEPNGLVKFINSTDKTIKGDNNFYDLTFDPVNDPTLFFEAGKTQTTRGTLTLNGTDSGILFLQSTIPGNTWNIDPQGARDISYVEPSDSANINGAVINAAGTGSIDGGNNTGWNFGLPVVSNLGPTEVVNGSATTNKQPSFTFNVVDTDATDDVKYKIQIDNNSDFSSPIVDFTSALSAQGNLSFTVGQEVNGGTYTTGFAGQKLTAGSYYWRVKGIDEIGNESNYLTANSGNIAFSYSAAFLDEPVITQIGTILFVPNQPNLSYYFLSLTPYIEGTSVPGSTVYFIIGDNTYSAQTDSNGHFAITLNDPALSTGTNVIHYYSVFEDSISSARVLTLVIGCENFPGYLKLIYCPLSIVQPGNPGNPGNPANPPKGGLPITGNGNNFEEIINGTKILSSNITLLEILLFFGSTGFMMAMLSLLAFGISSNFIVFSKRIGILIGIVFPKKKKYWGVIYDEAESKGVPFAVVRLTQKGVLKQTTVSDLEGRYGFLIDQEGKYTLEVKSDGFKDYSSDINIKIVDSEVIEDVKLDRIGGKVNFINKIRFYSKKESFIIINTLWLIVALVGLSYTIVTAFQSPDLLNLIIIVLYGVLLTGNLLVLYGIRLKSIGKVKDIATNQGIENAAVRFYSTDRQILVWLTNKTGSLKVNLKQGKYTLQASKAGYEQIGSKDIEITKSGFINKNIQMKKVTGTGASNNNPFGS